jgi:hypothetical protein
VVGFPATPKWNEEGSDQDLIVACHAHGRTRRVLDFPADVGRIKTHRSASATPTVLCLELPRLKQCQVAQHRSRRGLGAKDFELPRKVCEAQTGGQSIRYKGRKRAEQTRTKYRRRSNERRKCTRRSLEIARDRYVSLEKSCRSWLRWELLGSCWWVTSSGSSPRLQRSTDCDPVPSAARCLYWAREEWGLREIGNRRRTKGAEVIKSRRMGLRGTNVLAHISLSR